MMTNAASFFAIERYDHETFLAHFDDDTSGHIGCWTAKYSHFSGR